MKEKKHEHKNETTFSLKRYKGNWNNYLQENTHTGCRTNGKACR